MSKRYWLAAMAAVFLCLLMQACASKASPTEVVAVASPTSSQPAASPVPTVQEDAAVGAIYYYQNCTPCHGNEGEGVNAPPLRNSQFIQTAAPADIQAVIANGIEAGGMPAWLQANAGPLTDPEIADMVGFLKKLQGVSQIPPATAVPPEPTETPAPAGAPTEAPAQPSTNATPGPALTLTGDAGRGKPEFGLYCAGCHGPQGVMGIPNLDSDDMAVPEINPIDPTIANADPKVFAAQMDPFVEHGSIPAGPGPRIAMPAFGDDKLLTPEQIADLIAYVISINKSQ